MPPLPTKRVDFRVLATSTVAEKSRVSRPSPVSLLALGSLVARRRPIAGRRTCSLTILSLVAMTRSSTSLVVSPSMRSLKPNGRRLALLDRQALVERAVDLQLGDRAQADAHAERRRLEEVAGQARRGIEDVVRDVEAGLDQDAAAADRLGVLGHERALLGGGGASRRRTTRTTATARRIAAIVSARRRPADRMPGACPLRPASPSSPEPAAASAAPSRSPSSPRGITSRWPAAAPRRSPRPPRSPRAGDRALAVPTDVTQPGRRRRALRSRRRHLGPARSAVQQRGRQRRRAVRGSVRTSSGRRSSTST